MRDLKQLRRLNLLGAQVTDASLQDHRRVSPALRELNLYRSRVTNAGLANLAKLKNLRLVDLRYSKVTSAGVQTLHLGAAENENRLLRFLAKLTVSENLEGPAKDTEAGVRGLGSGARRRSGR